MMKEENKKPVVIPKESPLKEVRKSMTVAPIPTALKPQAPTSQASTPSSEKKTK